MRPRPLPASFRISEHTVTIGRQLEQRTVETNQLIEQQQHLEHVGGSREKQEYVARAKTVVNEAAVNLEQYAALLGTDLKQFKVENRAMFENLGRVVVLQQEFNTPTERLHQDTKALQNLVTVLATSREKVTEFQATVSRMPALTGKLKKARKRASATLGEFIAELQFFY